MRSDWSVDRTSHLGSFAFSRSDFAARYRPYDPHNGTRCKSYQKERRYRRTRKIGGVGERHRNMKWGIETTEKRNRINRIKVQQTGNVRLPRHRGAFVKPLLQWKSNEYYILWVCVCSLRYPACKAHAPCHLWPAPLYNSLPRHFINGTIFDKKVILI